MYLGVNVFSIRKLLIEKRIEVWDFLGKSGIAHVELMMVGDDSLPSPSEISAEMAKMLGSFLQFVVPFSKGESLVSELHRHGLNVDCIHVALAEKDFADMEALTQTLIRFGETSGVRNFVIGIDHRLDRIRELTPKIRRMASELKRNALQLIYHNHHKECGRYGDSSYLEYLISECPDLMIEADVGWMHFAHFPILPFLSRFADRLAYIHLKDLVTTDGTLAFVPIGSGEVPTEAVLRFAKDHGFQDQLIIDQDESTDIIKDLQTGIAFIEKTFRQP